MVILLGHLPSAITEKDIKDLMSSFSSITDVAFIESKEIRESAKPSDYECKVTLETSNPVAANIITNKLNHFCWKECTITAHLLVF